MAVRASPPAGERETAHARNDRGPSFRLTVKEIQRFLSDHEGGGYTADTVRLYRSALYAFYDYLPEDKRVCRDVLPRWYQSILEQGYSPRTAGTRLSAVNSLLDYLGWRNLQWYTKLERAQTEPQELTREEYIRLLHEARKQEDITLYLLVKTFAATGLPLQCLTDLTREAVNSGVVQTERKKYSRTVKLPAGLRRELLDYAMREGIRTGPVFRTAAGAPLQRTIVTHMISRLGAAAGLEPGKANPQSLKRLYQNTFAEYQRQADAWMQDSYTRLLAEEEQKAGWLAGGGDGVEALPVEQPSGA